MTHIRIWWKALQFLEKRPEGETISSIRQNVFMSVSGNPVSAVDIGEVLHDMIRAGVVEKFDGGRKVGREITLYRVTEAGMRQIPRVPIGVIYSVGAKRGRIS